MLAFKKALNGMKLEGYLYFHIFPLLFKGENCGPFLFIDLLEDMFSYAILQQSPGHKKGLGFPYTPVPVNRSNCPVDSSKKRESNWGIEKSTTPLVKKNRCSY